MNLFTNILKLTLIIISLNTVLSEDKIIIVGAGPSGIAAASKLLEHGIKNLLILEAEPRIGGRINTVNVDGKKIDMGAQWCDGQRGNIVYNKLEELHILELLQHDHFPKQFYSSLGYNISYEFSEELEKIFKKIQTNFTGSKESLGSVLKKRYIEAISQTYKNNPQKLDLAQSAMDYLAHSVLSTGGSINWCDAAADDPKFNKKEGYAAGWKNGFASFLDVLTKKYPNPENKLPIDDRILLNKEVIKITYDENNAGNISAIILCTDNSTYTAKHIIVTISLGVLKKRAHILFEPKLSKTKIDAIKNIGYGAILKVFVTFKTQWWGDSPGFNFIWSKEDKVKSRYMFPFGSTNQNGDSWIVEHFQILTIQNSNILLVWFTGGMVSYLETMDENVLRDGIHFTLNLFLGHLYDIPKPEKLLRSNWYSNPHFRGTNSYTSLNTSSLDRRNLKSPILNFKGEPIVQFAGEATNVQHHSSVNGAVESGFEEADRLIKFYKK